MVLALFTNCIATDFPAGVGAQKHGAARLVASSLAYSAPSIVACSIAAGILATDMSDRAIWLRS